MIKVSIIVPVYKVPLEYLRGCLDSLVAQTLQECEFIIVSDGASDTECFICEEYAAIDKRFKFFKREHAGVSAARNYGIEQAQGDYLTFVDADDWIEKETCETVYQFAKQNNSEIVFWDLFFEEQKKKKDYTEFYFQNICHLSNEENSVFQDYIIYNPERKFLVPPLTVCKLFKRDLINLSKVRFDSNLSRGEDRVFNFQITTQTKNIAYLKKTFYHYVIHASSTEQSFHEHDFLDLLAFIQRLDALSDQKKRASIANETIGCFFRCTSKLYEVKLSPRKMYSELMFLKKQIKAEPFHTFIQETNLPHFSFLARCEIALMKKGITLFTTLRFFKILFHSCFSWRQPNILNF